MSKDFEIGYVLKWMKIAIRQNSCCTVCFCITTKFSTVTAQTLKIDILENNVLRRTIIISTLQLLSYYSEMPGATKAVRFA